MKKNIYLIIITIITVVCIIAGSLYHIGGFALGLFDNLIPRSDKSLGNVCTEELSVDEFSNLVFDTTISNINVKTGDSYMVSYKCNKRLVPKVKSTGDTLTISQSNGANYKRNTTSEITVTIPEGAALNKLSLDTGVGEVNLNSLTAADAEFDTGIGDLYVTDCSFATCDVDGGTGDSYMVSYKCNKRLVPKVKSTGDTLTISQSNGANYKRNTTSEITVTIPEGAALNKLSLDTGVGEVNLNSLTAADAEFDTGIGDLYVTDCSFATCDVDGGTGNLSFENCAFDEMDIDGGTGNITVTSSQSLDSYMMDLDSGTGDITINGNDYDDEYEVNEHAKKHLVIDSGLGDIVVKY